MTVAITILLTSILAFFFFHSMFAIYSIYLFLNSRPTKELRKKIQTKGGLWLIFHSGFLLTIIKFFEEINFEPLTIYIQETNITTVI